MCVGLSIVCVSFLVLRFPFGFPCPPVWVGVVPCVARSVRLFVCAVGPLFLRAWLVFLPRRLVLPGLFWGCLMASRSSAASAAFWSPASAGSVLLSGVPAVALRSSVGVPSSGVFPLGSVFRADGALVVSFSASPGGPAVVSLVCLASALPAADLASLAASVASVAAAGVPCVPLVAVGASGRGAPGFFCGVSAVASVVPGSFA